MLDRVCVCAFLGDTPQHADIKVVDHISGIEPVWWYWDKEWQAVTGIKNHIRFEQPFHDLDTKQIERIIYACGTGKMGQFAGYSSTSPGWDVTLHTVTGIPPSVWKLLMQWEQRRRQGLEILPSHKLQPAKPAKRKPDGYF